MKEKKIKTIALLLVMMFSYHAFAQNSVDISKYNCQSTPIKYTIDGEESEGILVFINHKDRETPVLQYSDVYVLNKNGQNIRITGDSVQFISVYDMKVSKSSKYLATYNVGEGHPWIEIYDLQKIISEEKQNHLSDINPYPGNVELIGWQNDNLIVESDINLLPKNDGKDLSDKDMFEKNRKYLYSIVDKKFKEYK